MEGGKGGRAGGVQQRGGKRGKRKEEIKISASPCYNDAIMLVQ